ncbi:MAG: DUF4345 family protein [Anditalea sp.]
MKFLNYTFFYTYVGLVVLAGFWGAFIYPYLDFIYLFNLDVNSLPEYAKVNLLSQYRFLRALELGYGLFSLYFLKEIFSKLKYNKVFLTIMGLGILSRVVSWIIDGAPSHLFMFFLSYEAVGWAFIFVYSRKIGIYHVSR